jgi:hypothetical protein
MRMTTAIAALAVTGLAAPAWAATDAECRDMWQKADANRDGALTDNESVRYVAFMRLGNRTVAGDGRITQAEFMDACKADIYKADKYKPGAAEKSAPLKGANSFTEGQAKDRAVAYGGVDSVADMKKDDDGVWRGTGTQAGKAVQIAVDYKGNVVTSAQQ